MIVTFVLPSFPTRPVGGYLMVYEYANRLVSRGHVVQLVHFRALPNCRIQQDPPPPGWVAKMRRRLGRGKDLLVERMFSPQPRWFPVDRRVRMIFLPRFTPRNLPDGDAIVFCWWSLVEMSDLFPTRSGRPFYLAQGYEDWWGNEDRVRAVWRRRMPKIVIAHWLLEKGRALGVPPEELMYVPNGINMSVHRLIRPLESRTVRVSMVYSPLPIKGGADGLKALALSRAQEPAMTARIFGVGRRPPGCPEWVEYYRNPSRRVIVEEIYNQSAVFLCSSWQEGWGLPGAEAMACGCALVSSDHGGVREYAEHGRSALISSPRDPEGLAENLVGLLKAPHRRIALAGEGYREVQNFDLDRSTDRLEEALSARVH